MTLVAPPQVKPAPSVRDLILRGLLAVALLVPITVLFGQVWQDKSGQAAAIADERDGVAYLRTLVPLVSALSYAESIAVNGDKADLTPVDRAWSAVAAVDKSPGVSDGTHARFVDLDTKIQQLHTHKFTTPQDAFNTFSAVTALALGLAEEARAESGLIHDVEPDVYFLEDAAARQMLISIVTAGQYGDLVAIEIGQSAAARQNTIGQIAAARAVILNAASILGDDVQQAVDAKPSETLSGQLPARLDKFRLAIDSMVPPAALPNQQPPSAIDFSMALSDKARVETAATELSSAMLDAVDGLLVDRAAAARSGERDAIAALGVAVLLAFLPLLAGLNRRRRANRDQLTGRTAGPPNSPDRTGGPGGGTFLGGDTLPRREGSRARELRELSGVPR
jgi:hypothetical protein